MNTKHIIKRQVIEVKVPSRLNNVEIQDRLAILYKERIVALIDKLLSDSTSPGVSYKINTLQIDLGAVYLRDLESCFLDKCEEELQQKFSDLKGESIDGSNEAKRGGASIKKSDLELLIFFCETGSFPWWAEEASYKVLAKSFSNVINDQVAISVLGEKLLHNGVMLRRIIYALKEEDLLPLPALLLHGKAVAIKQLKSVISTSLDSNATHTRFKETFWSWLLKNCFERRKTGRRHAEAILESFETGVVQQLIANGKSTGLNTNALKLAIAEVFNLKLVDAFAKEMEETRKEPRRVLLKEMEELKKELEDIEYRLQSLIDKELVDAKTLEELKSVLTNVRGVNKAIFNTNPPRLFANNGMSYDLIRKGVKDISHSVTKICNDVGREKTGLEKYLNEINKNIELLVKEIAALKFSSADTLKATITKTLLDKDASYDAFSASDKIYVQNAGLVLLWPFLNRFFENTGLCDSGHFVNEEAADLACLLLQYMVEGSDESFFEPQLPLNKVMCGLDLQRPFDTQLSIGEDYKEAANNFLEAVIQNGPLWKNLSVEAFREAYLKREGALGTRDGNLLLQVKRETYDIIVDKLPWTIQVVKFPWMKNLLFVEWQKT